VCLWWPAPPSIFVDDLVVSLGGQTVLNPVVTWLKDLGLGGQEQPDHTPDVAKERVSPPTYNFIYWRQLWEGGDFHVRDKFIPEDAKYSANIFFIFITLIPGSDQGQEFSYCFAGTVHWANFCVHLAPVSWEENYIGLNTWACAACGIGIWQYCWRFWCCASENCVLKQFRL